MTAKEKAQNLVDFFRNYTDGSDPETNRFSPRIERLNSVKCSLKVVEEVIQISESRFWDDVKEELEEMK